ncbi:MAG: hypothetical protein J6X89_00405 [Bacteroidales bacterium]|nr:hypothetical protein [Bacteroidales bacterium]
MAKEIKDRIAVVLDRTFQVLDKCYVYNDEATGKANLQASGSRLIFPCYSKTYRDGERRISEQELRFVFIEQFNKYCEETGWDAYYSVETPTEWKYRFSGEAKPHKTKEKDGQSAMVDVCIHDNKGSRVCLIEFKAGNPEAFCYIKDLVKLQEEGQLGFFVQLLEKQNSATWPSIIGKIESDLNGINYVCHTFGPLKYHGTQYISETEVQITGWKKM